MKKLLKMPHINIIFNVQEKMMGKAQIINNLFTSNW